MKSNTIEFTLAVQHTKANARRIAKFIKAMQHHAEAFDGEKQIKCESKVGKVIERHA